LNQANASERRFGFSSTGALEAIGFSLSELKGVSSGCSVIRQA
jgi:hypothetical protein